MTVAAVVPGSDAERAGLQVSEAILEVNGKMAAQEFSEEMAQLTPGDTIALKVRARRGGERDLKWKVGSREEKSYELKDVEKVTAEQRARRAAWLKGEAETPQAAHSH
jgi:predicted metalloprotease with PDZ domain